MNQHVLKGLLIPQQECAYLNVLYTQILMVTMTLILVKEYVCQYVQMVTMQTLIQDYATQGVHHHFMQTTRRIVV